MISYQTQLAPSLQGDVLLPGDKSISHRSVILGSIAQGITQVSGFLTGADNRATLQIMRNLGVVIDEISDTELVIYGVGVHGLRKPNSVLDCGNAGTAMRLLLGLLAPQSFDSVLTGDCYLLKRPMRRVTEPLTHMGAHIQTQEAGTAPLLIRGNSCLHGMLFDLPIASAQVKSCLLLAGIYAAGKTQILESQIVRDHTERMLLAMGYPLEITQLDADRRTIALSGGHQLHACDIKIPSDLSSAAFFMVAATIHPEATITLRNVGINPTRDGVIRILKLMGAHLEVTNQRQYGNEPVADITVYSSQLHGIDIPNSLVSLAIDELPVLMIAAACAKGTTVLRGASELRVKETDRISAMTTGLRALGIDVETYEDGMSVSGGTFCGGQIDSQGDHRIAMSFLIAGSVSTQPIRVTDCDNIATSFPNFITCATQLGMICDEC